MIEKKVRFVQSTLLEHKKIAIYIYSVIFPLVLFFSLERLNPASSAGLFAGVFPNMGPLLLSAFLIFLMAAIVYSLAGSVLLSYGIVSFVLLVGYIINYFKLAIAGGVFVPSDIFLANAAFQVTEPGAIRISAAFVISVLLVILVHVPLYFVKFKLRFSRRIIAMPVICAFIFIFLTGGFAVNRVFPVFGLDMGTVTDRYRENGMLLGFYSELMGGRTSSPEFDMSVFAPIEVVPDDNNGNEITIGDSNYTKPCDEYDHGPPLPVIPNVIVIMSEAFMDPTIMDNLTFSQYPIPNFRRLSHDNLSGNVLVPVFGGGTIATEFEFLTGASHLFYGSRFYIPQENPRRYFSREIPTALPWLFRQNGYRAIAVHPFNETFFNRNTIYPLIGFEALIAREQMPNARYRGPFVSDEYFTDRIIEQILLAEEEEMPLFLFGISMQNHWGFEPLKYGTLDLDIMSASPYLNTYEIQRMNAFLQGVFDADKQLGRLADFIESRDTPTILVFFGDHLPILGRHSDRIFEKLGFVTQQEDFNWTLEDRINVFHTPYLVWANYDLGQEDWGNMSAFMLGAMVAETSGISLNRYFSYVLRSRDYFHGITNELYLDAYGVYHMGWQYRHRPHVRALESLWYASMFGEDDVRESLAYFN